MWVALDEEVEGDVGGADGGAGLEFGFAGEFVVDARADDDVASDAQSGGDDGAFADDGDAGIDDIGAFGVGDVGVAGADDAVGADGDFFVEDAAVDDGAGADDAAVLDDGFADDGAGFDDGAGGDDGAVDLAVDAGSGGDEGFDDVGVGAEAGGWGDGAGGAEFEVGVFEVEGWVGLEEVHVGGPVGFDGADVAPVVEVLVAEDAVGLEHAGDDVAAEVVGAGVAEVGVVLEAFDEGVFVEDVDAHGDPGAAGFFGFFLEVDDAAGGVEVEDAEAMGLAAGDAVDGDGGVGALGAVVGDEVAVGGEVDVVAGEDEDFAGAGFFDDVEVLVDGVGGAVVPVGVGAAEVGLEDLDAAFGGIVAPGAAGADVVEEGAWAVLGEDGEFAEVAVGAVGEDEVDDAVVAAEDDCWFGALFGEDGESVALAACEDHGEDFVHGPSPSAVRAPGMCPL